MLFNWNDSTIRWYINASDYTGFFKNIADEVKPSLSDSQTLCDMGCGLGLFDFEVAPMMTAIDCVDVNDTALSSVRERAAQRGLHHIKTRLTNCDCLHEQWDVVYMSFFGSRELDRFLNLCKKLIAVVGVPSETDIFPSKNRAFRKNTVDNTVHYLDQRRIPYKLTTHTFEFGQPFSSRLDAENFIHTYVPDIEIPECDAFLDERLVTTDNTDYPLYIPRRKSVGIFELEGSAL